MLFTIKKLGACANRQEHPAALWRLRSAAALDGDNVERAREAVVRGLEGLLVLKRVSTVVDDLAVCRYSNCTNNDLDYWGLDYPPLSAYQVRLTGITSDHNRPSAVICALPKF